MAISLRNSLKFITIILIVIIGIGPFANAEDQSPKLYEQKIKAGLIYNFLKFTTWPQAVLSKEKNQINVCLYGGDAFDGYLNPINGRTAQQYTINVLQPKKLTDLYSCHLVFINRNQSKNLAEILKSLKDKNIMTMSDMDNFSTRGGMVEFAMEKDKHIHLYINENAIKSAGISIQDRLLKLAKNK